MIHLRRHTEASSQQSFLRNVCLGTGPACKHEGDLVHKICNVVDHIEVDLIHGSEEVAEKVAKRVNRQPSVTMRRMLLKELATAALQSLTEPPASPAKISKRMKAQPHMPKAKPMNAGTAEISPRYPKRSIRTVPPRSLQNIAELVSLPAALRIRLNSIICNGTVMLQST